MKLAHGLNWRVQADITDDVSRNGKVRSLENVPIHKNNENTGKHGQNQYF